ncbi:MAG: DEAD/DEAH box helicase [Microbacteriaceae bacterium]|nr:DEAD/DEAH box helicase [Microbacteriaceae bacterium]
MSNRPKSRGVPRETSPLYVTAPTDDRPGSSARQPVRRRAHACEHAMETRSIMPKFDPPRPHRGQGAPAGKARWTDSDRKKREERNAERGARGDRPARPAYGDRTARPARGERPDWSPKAPRTDRSDRPAYGDRPARPSRDGGRDWRPRGERTERPAYGDRPARPYGDRPERGDRPAYGERNDRPARSFGDRGDRAPRVDRPARGERPDWQPREERAPRRDWDNRTYGDRPARERFERSDRETRPAREWTPREDRTERPKFTPTEEVVHERLEATAIDQDATEGMAFSDLGLGENIVRQLAEMGASAPFPIQAATIPEVLAGRDVLGRGRTGSGKTIAFGAPLVERLLRMQREGGRRSMGRKPRALILAPTRELAQQIDRTVQPIARSVGLFTIAIVGGVPYAKQLTGLQRGADIVIGTPGRIEDLVEKGHLDLSDIKVTVLDEADHMCDLGFLEPVQRILRLTPDGSQRLLFSATLDAAIEALVSEFLREPSVHEVAGEDQASSTITHKVLMVDASAKRDVVRELVESASRSIVFTRTRAFAEEVAEGLMISGIPATSLHGDLNQARRNRNLQLLTRGDVRSLVATDVAARGIHVDDIDLVIQADMPDDHKTYLHRAGRTGRAGAQGTVITVISPSRRRRLEEQLRTAGIEAEWEDRATTRPRRDGEGRPRFNREDRAPRADRAERPFAERAERPVRQPRMSADEFAEFQAWKAARDAAAAE